MAKNTSKISNLKAVVFKHSVRITEFAKPYLWGNQGKKRSTSVQRKEKGLLDEGKSVYKSKQRLTDLITANAGQYLNIKGLVIPLLFLTFTFADNIQDLDIAHRFFRNFIKRLGYFIDTKVKYVAVYEYQARGAIHYHVLFFNLPYIPAIHSFMDKCWGQGFVFGKVVNNTQSASRYLTKYIQKELNLNHIKNRRRFLCSKGLIKPKKINDQEVIKELVTALPTPQETKEFNKVTEELGEIHTTILNYDDSVDIDLVLENLPKDTILLARKILGVKDD